MIRVFSIVVSIFLFARCTASKVVSFYIEDENNIHFQTFSFYKRDIKNLSPEQARLDSLLEQTITEGLKAKGYSKRYPSDVYVSLSITSSNTSSSDVNSPSYYRRTYYPYYDVNITQYKEGVFLIEIHNQNDKLIWQGSKTFKVRNSKDTNQLLLQYASEIVGSFKSRS